MSYRDELQGLRARVDQLQDELDQSKKELARLRGQSRAMRLATDESVDWVSGVPRQLWIERLLPFELTHRGVQAIAELVDERLPGGSATQIGRSFAHNKGSYQLRLSPTDGGETRVLLKGDYSIVRTLLLLGGPAFGLITALLGAISVALLRAPAALLVVGAIAGFVAGVWALRTLSRRAMLSDQQRLRALVEALVDVAGQHQRPKSRIEVPAPAQVQLADPSAAELEHDQGAEQERQERADGEAGASRVRRTGG